MSSKLGYTFVEGKQRVQIQSCLHMTPNYHLGKPADKGTDCLPELLDSLGRVSNTFKRREEIKKKDCYNYFNQLQVLLDRSQH